MQKQHQPQREEHRKNQAHLKLTDHPVHKPHPQHILLGAAAFMQSLQEESRTLSRRLLVQAMTFEGDDAGRQLIRLMQTSPAADRRLCIDHYSGVVVNDRFVYPLNYFIDGGLRREVQATRTLRDQARGSGIGVFHTNPTGPLLLRYPFRNHRKMVICDDTVYLGGINFSEHNFAWHDMMIRLHDPILADLLAAGFDQNTLGRKISGCHDTPSGRLFLTHRNRDSRVWEEIFGCFEAARSEILIISPYVTAPLLDILRSKCRPEVRITIISPEQNNKSLLKRYLLAEAGKGYFNLRLYRGGMSHLKAALIDGQTLLAGSSNFDFASYAFEEEVVVAIRDPDVIEEFRSMVAEPMLAGSSPARNQPRLGDILASVPIRLISGALRLLS
jgi:cardiolipin synthase A/B